MPWDPSQRPRRPRIRTSHYFVTSPEERRKWFSEPWLELASSETAMLADLVPGSLPRGLLEYFIHAAALTFGWVRQSAEPPRPLIRYQLRLLAHLIWKARHRPEHRRSAHRELDEFFGDMDVETKARLLDGIGIARPEGMAPEFYLYSPDGLEFQPVFEGALIADRDCEGRGDYADMALHKTAGYIIWIYDMWTDTLPGTHRQEVGPTSIRGTRRTIAASPLAEFAYVFYDRVDPRLTKTRITSALNQRLTEVRKRKDAGWRDYHDLVNLLH